MISARGRDDAGSRRAACEKVRERTACLERPGVLQLLQLERERERRQTDVGAADREHGRSPDVGRDDGIDLFDVGSGDGECHAPSILYGSDRTRPGLSEIARAMLAGLDDLTGSQRFHGAPHPDDAAGRHVPVFSPLDANREDLALSGSSGPPGNQAR